MKKARICSLILGILGIFLIVSFGAYQVNISPVDKNSKADIEVIIPNGMNTSNIAQLLYEKNLIRNKTFFKLYIKLNGVSSIKASTYLFKKSMSLDEIVKSLEQGSTYNPDAVIITFQEGKTIKSYAKTLEQNTEITEEEFLTKMKDTIYINELINTYWFLTDDILNQDIYYPLEGYLAPDTYQFKNKDVSVEEVVKTLLDQEEKNLQPYQDILQQQSVHEKITMASIVELEGVTAEDRKMIVGVFSNRLAKGMNLGSDVTTYYAFQQEMTQDLTQEIFNTYNPYNTRSSKMAGKLPIGPICNPSKESIEAAINPTENDYFFFVADKNGKIYYTKTSKEHEQKVAEIKENGDWIW